VAKFIARIEFDADDIKDGGRRLRHRVAVSCCR
jgi:hypothetical protein